jgi:hypothetical protein
MYRGGRRSRYKRPMGAEKKFCSIALCYTSNSTMINRAVLALLGIAINLLCPSYQVIVSAQNSPHVDLAKRCSGYSFPEVVCMHRYASVLSDFSRSIPAGLNQPTFGDTKVANDSSFSNVKNASFLIWDEALAAEVLGETPKYEFMFELPNDGHEGPV